MAPSSYRCTAGLSAQRSWEASCRHPPRSGEVFRDRPLEFVFTPGPIQADRESQSIMADVQTSSAVCPYEIMIQNNPRDHCQVCFFNKLGFKHTGVKNFMSRDAGFPVWNMLRLPSQAVPNTG